MKRTKSISGDCGFTLIEMMIVLTIFLGITGVTYTLYQAQERAFFWQEQIVETNQDIRAFLYFIEKDIRIAGYNPTGQAISSPNDAGIIIAEPTRVEFTADLGMRRDNALCSNNEGCDSMPDEQINQIPCANCVTERMRYLLWNGAIYKVFNNRTPTTAQEHEQLIIQNVDNLEFLYHLSDGTTATTFANSSDRNKILSIDVSVLVRTRNTTRGYKGNPKFISASGANWTRPASDGYMRVLLVTNIKCRNMELRDEDM